MAASRIWTATAYTFADLVAALPDDRLAGPGLGEWTLRDLLGHAVSAGLVSVVDAINEPASAVAVETPEDYYALAKKLAPAIVRAAVARSIEDARATGACLGDRPADAVGQLVDRAVDAVSTTDPNALVTTAAGGMRLASWLPTRTFELAVHAMDIATAAGVLVDLPAEAIAESAALAARIAAVTGDGRSVLLALTGRQSLPGGFSVV